MVFRCSEIDGTQKTPPPAATTGPSFSVPVKNRRLRWGSTRLMRCELDSSHGDPTDRRPSSASPPPPPTSDQTKNDPSPSSGLPRLVVRISRRTQPKNTERDGPPAPEDRRDHRQETRERDGPPAPEDRQDHRQETREAASGGGPLEIARPAAGPVRRSLRTRASTQGDKKTGEKVSFSISLSDKEITEDFIAMTGAKSPRRPKQRPRQLQTMLDELLPGSDLPKIVTAGRYRRV